MVLKQNNKCRVVENYYYYLRVVWLWAKHNSRIFNVFRSKYANTIVILPNFSFRSFDVLTIKNVRVTFHTKLNQVDEKLIMFNYKTSFIVFSVYPKISCMRTKPQKLKTC